MKIEILREKCVGAGNCVELAAKIFGQDEADGKVVLKSAAEIDENPDVRQAAMLCPVGAILIDGKAP